MRVNLRRMRLLKRNPLGKCRAVSRKKFNVVFALQTHA